MKCARPKNLLAPVSEQHRRQRMSGKASISQVRPPWSQEGMPASDLRPLVRLPQPELDPSRQPKTIEQGVATQVWCATSPRLNGLGGVYCENVETARAVPPGERSGWASDDSTRKVGVMPHASDPVLAERLWSVSMEMTGAFARP